MIRVTLVLILFLSGCKTTGSNSNTEVRKFNHHPTMMSQTRVIKDISYAENVWVDFDFELKEKKESRKGMELRPFNIVILNSSHPSSEFLIPEAISTFNKWRFSARRLPNYSSKKYGIRLLISGNLNKNEFDCKSYSCIKK